MDRFYIEEQLGLYSICTISMPTEEELQELKQLFDVTDLGNNQIQIKYK